ncbi:MAG: RNA polymerase sigma factor region1.1 domain-containing protein [Deltaproteobacteria bacterium]|nr:RNA polymerase sigma factor region1.1 domain-containing protein [Deltaproteobacteria bacterium]
MLLDRAGHAIAATERARVYRLYQIAGSGDYLWVKAMGPKRIRWSVSVSDVSKADRAMAATLKAVESVFGKKAMERHDMERSAPYWRMWSELSEDPWQVLELDTKPALEFGSEWQVAELPLRPNASGASEQPVEDGRGEGRDDGEWGRPETPQERSQRRLLEHLMDLEEPPDGKPLEERSDVKALLAMGEKQGFVLYDQLLSILSALGDMPFLVDEVIQMLERKGVRILESAPKKAPEKRKP